MLGIRELDKRAVGQQLCGPMMGLGAQKGLNPGAGEQDRGVDPGEKLLLGRPGEKAESGVEPAPGRCIDSQLGTCREPGIL